MGTLAAIIVFGFAILVVLGAISKGIDDSREAKDRRDARKAKGHR